MTRKEITTKEDLMKIIELFESIGITYWLEWRLGSRYFSRKTDKTS